MRPAGDRVRALRSGCGKFRTCSCRAPAPALATLTLTRIICPNCGHIGATSATLPRILVCSQCEHGAFIKQGSRARSLTVMREEKAAEQAAWDRYEAMATQTKAQA
jgi:hypothetical protein